jgi:hypothetical protein
VLDDRRVYAECANFDIVRYERAGKWYVESKIADKRIHIGVADAALRSLSAETLGGEIHLGLPGGRTFDQWVKIQRAAHG